MFWSLLLACWGGCPSLLAAGPAGASCELWKDRTGITHARSGDELGVFGCLGYLHGRDRAWQMDYFRRAYQGRLSEVLGTDQFTFDFRLRLMDLPKHAARIVAGMDPEFARRLGAYAEGVNRGMAVALEAGGYEFKDFGYRPEPWQPIDTIGVLLLQSFDQTRLPFGERIQNRLRAEKFGKDSPALFSEDGLPWDTAILKKGEYRESARPSPRFLPERDAIFTDSSSVAASSPALQDFFAPLPTSGFGSNNWVVAPALSTSGRALFANDPHLGLKTPAFWYWAHVTGGSIDAMGATLPGAPAIVSGLNRQVAWGLTNAYMDVGDVVAVPELDLKDATVEFPLIWVKVWKFRLPFFFKAIRRTMQGWPVLPLPAPEGKALVLRWVGFDLQGSDLGGFSSLMKAGSAREMDDILARTRFPNFNFVFADTGGHIGYRTVGLSPDRRRGLPFSVLSQTLESYAKGADWQFLSAEEMPHLLDPARGYVVTANNRQWPAEAESFVGRNFRPGFRAFRIEELLRAGGKHDAESFKKIQCDVQAVDARFLAPPLLANLRVNADLTPREKRAMRELLTTPLEAGPACTACPIYRLWLDHLKEKGMANERSLYRMLQRTKRDPEFDRAVRKAFGAALDDLKVDLASPFKTWAEVHRTRFSHFAGKDYRRNALVSTPGDENAVNASIGKWVEEDKVLHQDFGASQRLVVELTDPPRAQLSFPGAPEDVPDPETRADSAPWSQWARCRYQNVEFPLDWGKVRTTRVELGP